MLSLTDIPQSIDCHMNGHRIVKDLSLSERFEVLVAQVVQGKLAARGNAGFDVYESEPHPRLTFQVKVSNTWQRSIKDRAEVFTFGGKPKHTADYYILFGLRDELVYPFLLSLNLWKRHGSIADTQRILVIRAERYTRRRKTLEENRLWNCFISDWPDGLHRRLRQHQSILL